MADENLVSGWQKVNGITLGDVVSINYDRNADVILIIEDKGQTLGNIKHTFGARADGLKDLILALQEYHKKVFSEREQVFEKILKRIDS